MPSDTYTHTYASTWSGFDPCGYGFTVGNTDNYFTPSNNGYTITLHTDDPLLVVQMTSSCITARWTSYPDTSTPTPTHCQTITISVDGQCAKSVI